MKGDTLMLPTIETKPLSNIIVTGANGYIGRHFIQYALQQSVKVTAIIRNKDCVNHLINIDGIRFIQYDLNQGHGLFEVLQDEQYDVFYHFAWDGVCGAKRANYELQMKNVLMTCYAAELAKKLGCRRFISTGTITEKVAERVLEKKYAAENLIYGLAKIYAHTLLDIIARQMKLDYIWARLSNIYGGDNTAGNLIAYTVSEIENGRIPTYGPCLQPLNFTHIKDTIRALFILGAAVSHERNQYFISDGECRMLKEYLTEAAMLCGGKVGIGIRPDDGIEYMEEWFKDMALHEEFGFEPEYSFERGMMELFKHTDVLGGG